MNESLILLIVLFSSSYGGVPGQSTSPPVEDTVQQYTGMPLSEFVLTALRTALDVVRNVNKQRALTAAAKKNSTIPLVCIFLYNLNSCST